MITTILLFQCHAQPATVLARSFAVGLS